ncbi:MAG TPA: 4'-phosphopantetheinyl transferase superfamily protein [Candidatus Poseidoniales archaeon]|nr:MAG TPA: 4'-phosphopantetheinyl transferase superfamily protein [Candidatus Poseidoniales archaeon]DAC57432.1 MAG TPA: 4'-phosphopantetheinyl transferase superfamily protein [Candidatus Poseidoniales archaeon]|tara:strand:- start:11360 stop:12127 length:768 start_codon:yes stop_codon:yes gene_type:complete
MVELMQEIPVQFDSNGPRLLCFMAPVTELDISQVQLANADEVAKFVTKKRKDEHLSGRLLLEMALEKWGIDTSLLEVRRNEFRAPSIAYLPGTWVRHPLPSISIGHSNEWAFVALIESGWTIGIDGEPLELEISSGVFELMAKGEELTYLQNNADQALTYWTSKEAVQKAARLGMNLNPREIKIPIGNNETKIPIENLNFQLKNLSFNGYNISVAISQGEGYDSIPEDDLLDQTLEAMQADEDWSIGCKTTRTNT